MRVPPVIRQSPMGKKGKSEGLDLDWLDLPACPPKPKLPDRTPQKTRKRKARELEYDASERHLPAAILFMYWFWPKAFFRVYCPYAVTANGRLKKDFQHLESECPHLAFKNAPRRRHRTPRPSQLRALAESNSRLLDDQPFFPCCSFDDDNDDDLRNASGFTTTAAKSSNSRKPPTRGETKTTEHTDHLTHKCCTSSQEDRPLPMVRDFRRSKETEFTREAHQEQKDLVVGCQSVLHSQKIVQKESSPCGHDIKQNLNELADTFTSSHGSNLSLSKPAPCPTDPATHDSVTQGQRHCTQKHRQPSNLPDRDAPPRRSGDFWRPRKRLRAEPTTSPDHDISQKALSEGNRSSNAMSKGNDEHDASANRSDLLRLQASRRQGAAESGLVAGITPSSSSMHDPRDYKNVHPSRRWRATDGTTPAKQQERPCLRDPRRPNNSHGYRGRDRPTSHDQRYSSSPVYDEYGHW
ncbi:hypothetical protein K461DRAFT_264051 [Myriangium duriaei CBS 260.36]|uniref:Uncharacterized protein n=1 Tax=Myriangium duriaei CBS 260.36 TaxID=1168546 RepID=A0A9P4MLA3_9PEZI|nr:hypothetical protein K461DRAFT_264051 [Myriangium duriaei CBS 260.36]